MLMMSCAAPKTNLCPAFPAPSAEAVNKIQGLHNPDVDSWMVELVRLKRQLNQ